MKAKATHLSIVHEKMKNNPETWQLQQAIFQWSSQTRPISASGKRTEPTGDKLVQAEQNEPSSYTCNRKSHYGRYTLDNLIGPCHRTGALTWDVAVRKSSLDPEDTKKRWVVMA